MADLSHFLSERLAALRAIRLHRTGREKQARLAAANARLNREVVGFQVLDAMATGVPGLLLTLALAWIYVVGGRLLEAGAISLGTFVAFVLYQGRLFGPAQGLLGLVRHLQEARVSLARVTEVLGADDDAPPTDRAGRRGRASDDDAIDAARRHLRLCREAAGLARRGPSRSARRARRALRRVGRGQVDARPAPVRPAASPPRVRCCVDGRPAYFRDRSRAPAPSATPVPSRSCCTPRSRRTCAMAIRRRRREDIERAAALAEADAFIAALPDRYATVIGGRGLALSDGQRQRLGLARLFLSDPRILVLDEAFSALDLEHRDPRSGGSSGRRFPIGRRSSSRTGRSASPKFDRILFLQDGRFDRGRARRTCGAPRRPLDEGTGRPGASQPVLR